MAKRGKYIIGIRLLLEKEYFRPMPEKTAVWAAGSWKNTLPSGAYPVEKKTIYRHHHCLQILLCQCIHRLLDVQMLGDAMDVCVIGLDSRFGEVLCRLGQHEILKNFRHGFGGKTVHFDGFFYKKSDRMPFVEICRKACGLTFGEKKKKPLKTERFQGFGGEQSTKFELKTASISCKVRVCVPSLKL